jgi:hypothetical protein
MAAGASDLIADSVRIPLQEEVSESAATLDELRGFLNSTRDRLRERTDGRAVEAKRPGRLASAADDLELDHEDYGDSESGLIPLPGEVAVADTAPADPFRSSATASPAAAAPASRGPSPPTRFSDAAVRAGLAEHNGGGTEVFGAADAGGITESLSSSAAATAARLLQDAEDFERGIFGDVSGKRGSLLQPLSGAVQSCACRAGKIRAAAD